MKTVGRGRVQGHLDGAPPMGRWWWVAFEPPVGSFAMRAWADDEKRRRRVAREVGEAAIRAFDDWNVAIGRPWRGVEDIEAELRKGRE